MARTKHLQAKNVDEGKILKLLGELPVGRSMSRWDLAEHFCTCCHPEKVLLAKLRKMVKQRKIEGCACGCRGDFYLRGLPAL